MVATCSSETLNDFQRPARVVSPKIQLFVGYHLLRNLLAYLDILSLLQNLFIITELSACLLFTREMYYFHQNFQLFNYLLVYYVQTLFIVHDIWGFMTVEIHVVAAWVVTPTCLVGEYQRFREVYCPYIQSNIEPSREVTSYPWEEGKMTNGRPEGRQKSNEQAPTEVQEDLKKAVTPNTTGRRKTN